MHRMLKAIRLTLRWTSEEEKIEITNTITNLPFRFLQNRRAKWRKREPPRKTGYINTNNAASAMVGGTQLAAPFATFQQNATVTPPGSVESWPSYQTPYEISSHFSLLSPAASPYGSFSQYGATYVHENQLYPVRQHYNYGSPPRVSNGEIDDKTEHYTTAMDDKYENPCNETYVYF